jgi:hypothetical protein
MSRALGTGFGIGDPAGGAGATATLGWAAGETGGDRLGAAAGALTVGAGAASGFATEAAGAVVVFAAAAGGGAVGDGGADEIGAAACAGGCGCAG